MAKQKIIEQNGKHEPKNKMKYLYFSILLETIETIY